MKSTIKFLLKKIAAFAPSFSYQKNSGYCPCCESKTVFLSLSPWFRDNYRCLKCMSIPRERALVLAINKHFPNWRKLSIHESSPGDSGASRFLKTQCNSYVASQFIPGEPLGHMVGGFTNQDLEKQTFADESFDLVITQDVFEHIYDPGRAFKEICRTLKQGGAHICSVPIINRFNKTEIWAEKGNNGSPIFLKTPEIHKNPVDEKGCPVTMHWGFDIVDFIKNNTQMETVIEDVYDLEFGLSARFLEIFVSIKSIK